MKILAVATDNFEFYYDVVKELKQRDIPFVSISPTDPIPDNVKVIITTEQETEAIDFDRTVAVKNDVRKGVGRALSILSGKISYQQMILGIDPGNTTGVVLLGDGKILEKARTEKPERVRQIIERYMDTYDFNNIVVRIGHGDRVNRNRTINSLKGLALRIEIVNEEATTMKSDTPHLDAAKRIAVTRGDVAYGPYDVKATEGEKREMQRRSRIESKGEVTISRNLAKKVVEGDIELAEALKRQRKKKDKD
ncbi:MAG: hypothetical protein ACQESD_01705 [Thermoplasmatota archaeon]